ncbi:microcin C ABC transporter permease YejB [Bartonella sp. HY406]|uniref:microcin C ABC transporter permease YejB n=1 Tax=Bartonella sp. HY406 TaxID=2979331 RepID=UPI0021C89D6C|nr:microcin C ABC transporter permease YejB [Bartonella sp. HY406]UXN03197.1 microcin C ABC transporter permease YejB [Bartonella sp. HY406]
MAAYILRRLLLIIPTIIGILTITFVILQFTPGGPIETIAAQLQGGGNGPLDRISGGGGDMGISAENVGAHTSSSQSIYRGAQGMDPAYIKKLEEKFGFDKPAWQRYLILLRDYSTFNFGNSFISDQPIIDMIKKTLPVSVTLGLWLMLISYAISIPLGIRKALKDGSAFDVWTSAVIIIGYSIPGFLFGVMLIVFFAGGSFFDWFPLRGLTSDNFDELSWGGKILDYLWHITLPVAAMAISAFATTTLLTKNCFLEEIRKQYVVTARAKGLSDRKVLYGHVFRNAMLVVIAGFPAAFISSFFTGSLLIEMLFSLDGMGLMSYTAVVNRDYPVVLGTLFIFSLLGLVVALVSDLVYMLVDPRIDFEKRDV